MLLCEWLVTVEGMLPLPSLPALNLNGIEASVRSSRRPFSKLFATIICFLEDVGLIIFCALEPYRLSGALSEDLFLGERKLQQQPQPFNSLPSTPRIVPPL